jgi:MoxR-like ATPase
MSATTQPLFEAEVNIAQAARLMEALTDGGDSVFLWGKPGIGKTDAANALGVKKGRPVIEFHAALREPVDLRGIPVADLATSTTRWLVPDELPRADRDGPEGYLFCDEYNQSSPQMQAALAGLVLYGKVGDYRLPPGWRVIAAGNRVSDRAAAQRMPTQMRNRFAHLYVTPDVDAWATWATANNVAPEMVAFIRFRRELLHRMTKAAKYVHAPADMRLRLFASQIGDDVAAELDGFIKLYRSLGTLEDIVANPETAKLPKEASERYAVCTGLGRLATRKNFAAIMKYAVRLDREPQMLLVHDATVRDEKLKETAAYSNWAIENADLIMQS